MGSPALTVEMLDIVWLSEPAKTGTGTVVLGNCTVVIAEGALTIGGCAIVDMAGRPCIWAPQAKSRPGQAAKYIRFGPQLIEITDRLAADAVTDVRGSIRRGA